MPIDTHPKRDSDELRVIMNLSHPFNKGSVNKSISKTKYVDDKDMAIRYPKVDDLCNLIRNKSKKGRVKLFKRDL